MNKLIKFVSAAIIILAFTFGAIIAWKIADNIRQELRQDLQETFKGSLKEYGKK
jgi:hypothetical protein